MSILEKFEEVKICGMEQLTESDIQYCEQNQMAYEAAVRDYTTLLSEWEGVCNRQKECLPETDEERKPSPYLGVGKRISSRILREHLDQLNGILISQIVNEISSRYHVTIEKEKISNALSYTMSGTDRNLDETKPAERRILQYGEIVDQIFLQFSGKSLREQAEYELKSRCRKSAKNYRGELGYEKRGSCLIFTDGASCSEWLGSPEWKLWEPMAAILEGVAHYERNDFRLPLSIAEVISQYRLKNSEIPFPDCKKIQSMKLYKNGRVDIRFREGRFLDQFVTEYLLQESGLTSEEEEEENEISGSGS